MSAKRLDKLLGGSADSPLASLASRAQDMDKLSSALKIPLETALGDGISAANLRDDGELVVLASSAAVASRLRFEAETLIAAAKDAGFDALRVSVRVARSTQA